MLISLKLFRINALLAKYSWYFSSLFRQQPKARKIVKKRTLSIHIW